MTSQLGRPDDGTDVTGFFNIELFAPLISPDKFEHGMTKDKLIDRLSEELHEAFPGVVFQFSQMIGDNVEEAIAGVKGENSVKIFGPDLIENEKNADTVVETLKAVRGARSRWRWDTFRHTSGTRAKAPFDDRHLSFC